MERILTGLKELGISVIEVSGGEPFLRKDIFDIFTMLDRLGLLYTISTNGTLLTSDVIERLGTARGALQLAVSLDSLDRERYAKLRGRDLMPLVMKNIEYLSGHPLQIPCKINFTMNRLNSGETFDMLNYARSRGLYLSVFPVNQGTGCQHRCDDIVFVADTNERQQMSRIFKELARMRRIGEPLWEYSGFYDHAADYVLGKPVGPCDAGSQYLDLHADGKLAVCVDQPGIADLRLERMDKVLDRIALQKEPIRRCYTETPCCYTCTYNISITSRHRIRFLAEVALVRMRMVFTKMKKRTTQPAPLPVPDEGKKRA
jgi:MoaA/NifB/PqqE/SkfB family radical SAM enzyme